MHNIPSSERVGLARRLAAVVYDWLLLAALALVLTTVTWVLRGGREITPGTVWFQLLLLALVVAFFVGFWVRGGQTVGMTAWKFRVERRDGTALRPQDALLRAAAAAASTAALGLGFAWALLDRDARTLHDLVSRTRLVRIPAPTRRHKHSAGHRDD